MRNVVIVLIGAVVLPWGCGGISLPGGNTNQNSGANVNTNQNGGTGHTVDELPDLSDDDSFGSGEGSDGISSGVILVGMSEDLADDVFAVLADGIATSLNGTLVAVIPDIRVIGVQVEAGTEEQSMMLAEQLDNVDYAELNHSGSLAGLDEWIPQAGSALLGQYQLFATNAIAARAVASQGSESITVALLDSGYDSSHPEYASALVLDGMNYVDGGDLDDDITSGHGTGVLSLLAADPDSGQLAGLLPGFSFTVYKVSDSAGRVSLLSAVLGIIGAVNGDADGDLTTTEVPPADVINMSFSFEEDYPSLSRAVFKAEERSVVLAAAGGNNGRSSSGSSDRYPAGYSTVLGVGASDIEDLAGPFSNRSANLDVVAPGVDLLVATPGSGYGYVNGTSFASAQASAAAAWLKHLESQLSVNQIRDRITLRGDALPADSGFGNISARRLNLVSVLEDAESPVEPYIVTDLSLVEATGVGEETLVSNAVGQSASDRTPEAFTEEKIYWYGYFPGGSVQFELIDGSTRVPVMVDSVVPSSIELFLEFLRGIELGEVTTHFSILQQAILEVPDLGGDRRSVEILAIHDGVESASRTWIYNPLKRGYNIISYKNFDSSIWHMRDQEGDAFDADVSDVELIGTGSTPEINWRDGNAVDRVQLGSSIDPLYYVVSPEEEANSIELPVSLGACVGAEVPEQICGSRIELSAGQISRIVLRRMESGSSVFAALDVIYVP